MAENIFSADEVAEVQRRYPSLRLKSSGVLEGVLEMEAEYDGHRISDRFEVRIVAAASGRPPLLFDIGGRTESIAKKLRISTLDLHKNRDGSACMCVRQEEKFKFPPSSRLLQFVEQLAVPYLFGLARCEQTGQWPWQCYSHGFLGLLEFYADRTAGTAMEDFAEIVGVFRKEPSWKLIRKHLRKKTSAKRDCPCGSGKSIGKCHSQAHKGIKFLHGEIARLNLYHLIA